MKTIENIYCSFIVYALCLSLLSCAAPQEDSSQISEGISKTNEAFMSDLSNGDAAGVVSNYTADAQFMAPNADLVTGKEEIQNVFQSFIDAGINGIILESTEIEGIGNMAFEVGKYTLSIDEKVIDNGKYIVIWKKVGEDWKLHRDIFNSNVPLPVVEEADVEESSEEEEEGSD
jgi:ketosteroid isomerase-like protein